MRGLWGGGYGELGDYRFRRLPSKSPSPNVISPEASVAIEETSEEAEEAEEEWEASDNKLLITSFL